MLLFKSTVVFKNLAAGVIFALVFIKVLLSSFVNTVEFRGFMPPAKPKLCVWVKFSFWVVLGLKTCFG